MARPNKSDEWLTASSLLIIKGWARDGLTNKEIAKNMGISHTTMSDWMKKFPAFLEALKEGRKPVNVLLEDTMFRTMTGFYVDEVTTEWTEDADGNILSEKRVKVYKKYIPPNATMQIFMSTNRMPEKYKHKRQEEVRLTTIDQDAIKNVEEALKDIE